MGAQLRNAASVLLLLGSVGCVTDSEPLPPLPQRIYVANESDNSVSVIDAETYKVIGTIDAKNSSTHDLSLTRDGSKLFATNLASGRVSVMDTRAMETIASIDTGNRAHVVTLTNDNKQAWVANIGDDNISVVDATTYRILGTIPVGRGPTGLAFSHDGRFAYVSNQGEKSIKVIETASHQTIKSIPVGTNPHFLIVDRQGRVWGTNSGETNIYVIDPESNDIAGTLEVGAKPQQIAFGYKGTKGPLAYVTVGGTDRVVVVNADPHNLKIIEEIPVGNGPNGIWANLEGTRVFVGHDKGNEVRIIDTGTSSVISTVPVGRKPIRVVVSR